MNKIKKILFIAPLPPPITGQSLITEKLYDELKKASDVFLINYSRNDIRSMTKWSISQIIKIFKLCKEIRKRSKSADLLYITISQSLLGNLKDLLFLFVAGKSLRKRTIIHLHGGGFGEYYNNSNKVIKIINKYIFKDIYMAIVLSESLRRCLLSVVDEKKIEVVSNFVEDNLYIEMHEMEKKWNNIDKINLIFLSNFIEEKGYNELLDAFIELPDNIRDKYNLFFAGDFVSYKKKKLFLKKIQKIKNITFFGFVKNMQKEKLIKEAHIFILPTYYSVEGQPVCILEAYASGLVVITTDQGGITDIFKDNFNGVYIKKKSKEDIYYILGKIVSNLDIFRDYGFNNRIYANNFKKEIFVKKMFKKMDFILENK